MEYSLLKVICGTHYHAQAQPITRDLVGVLLGFHSRVMMPKVLDLDLEGSEGEESLRINKLYSDKYDTFRRKEELAKCNVICLSLSQSLVFHSFSSHITQVTTLSTVLLTIQVTYTTYGVT